MLRSPLIVTTGLLSLCLACGSDPAPPDAGAPDAAVDAGIPDSGPTDTGPAQATLTIDFKGLGFGRVSGGEIDCDEDCSVMVIVGTEVSLTAVASPDDIFQGWEGGGCGAEPTCTVTVDADLRLQARFDRSFELSIQPVGDGLGAVDIEGGQRCVGVCNVPVLSDTLQTIRAVPAAGVEFVGWSGDCQGPDPTCRIGINANKLVRPLFEVRRPQIAGGDQHFCAVHVQGGVRCWGRGHRGQLGQGAYTNLGDDEAVNAQGDLPIAGQVASVAAGGAHSCIVSSSGGVRCWGDNARGQLGRGDREIVGGEGTAGVDALADLPLPETVFQVAAGGEHTCALLASGAVRCWGRGSEGQLGYGNGDDAGDGVGLGVSELTDVPLGGKARFIAAGAAHTCAVLEAGGVKCWGSNASGQLGYGFAGNAGDGTSGRETPAELAELQLGAPVERLFLGPEHSCAAFEDRRVRCWGANSRGQLGDGSTDQVGGAGGLAIDTSIDVLLGGQSVVDVAVGAAHACVSLPSGEVRCWGGGTAGATGQEATADELSPPGPIELLLGHFPLDMAGAGNTTCAATRFGSGALDYAVVCWGDGQYGGLGSGSTTNVGDRADTMPPDVSQVF